MRETRKQAASKPRPPLPEFAARTREDLEREVLTLRKAKNSLEAVVISLRAEKRKVEFERDSARHWVRSFCDRLTKHGNDLYATASRGKDNCDKWDAESAARKGTST